MDPLLDDLRRRWWELVSGNHSRSHDPVTLREHLRALSTVDSSGAVWRIDPSSTVYDIRFTRQRRGGFAEPADPVSFASPPAPLTREVADAALAALDPGHAETRDDWTPREQLRAARSLTCVAERGARLVTMDDPRCQGGTTFCPIGIVEPDGSVTAAVDVQWVFRAGEWKIARWPMI